MKYLLPLLIFMGPTGYCIEQVEIVKASIKHLQPNLKEEQYKIIADSILKYSRQYNLDWKIMAAILGQESSFKKDPQGCLKGKKCKDFGIAQINYKVWGQPLSLDKRRLLVDIEYNIETMAKILDILQNLYGEEPRWHTRYHSFTPLHRKIYADFIYHKYLKIDSYSKGYLYANYKAKKQALHE